MGFSFVDIFFPKRCVGCKRVGSYLCDDCRQLIQLVQTPLCLECDRPAIGGTVHPECRRRYSADGITSVFLFKPPIRQLLHELKYRGVSDIVSLVTSLIDPFISPKIWQTQPILIPVPLHDKKKRERGFNQSELVAWQLSKLHDVSYQNVLKRTRPTQSQTKLDKFERQENVRDAFACTKRLDGQNIILIDDTVTTGATINACAKELKKAGANFIWAITVAQAPLRSQVPQSETW